MLQLGVVASNPLSPLKQSMAQWPVVNSTEGGIGSKHCQGIASLLLVSNSNRETYQGHWVHSLSPSPTQSPTSCHEDTTPTLVIPTVPHMRRGETYGSILHCPVSSIWPHNPIQLRTRLGGGGSTSKLMYVKFSDWLSPWMAPAASLPLYSLFPKVFPVARDIHSPTILATLTLLCSPDPSSQTPILRHPFDSLRSTLEFYDVQNGFKRLKKKIILTIQAISPFLL